MDFQIFLTVVEIKLSFVSRMKSLTSSSDRTHEVVVGHNSTNTIKQ